MTKRKENKRKNHSTLHRKKSLTSGKKMDKKSLVIKKKSLTRGKEIKLR